MEDRGVIRRRAGRYGGQEGLPAEALAKAGGGERLFPPKIAKGVVDFAFPVYKWPEMQLTKHEQLVIGLVLTLLLTGWAVKAFRAAHPAPAASSLPAHP